MVALQKEYEKQCGKKRKEAREIEFLIDPSMERKNMWAGEEFRWLAFSRSTSDNHNTNYIKFWLLIIYWTITNYHAIIKGPGKKGSKGPGEGFE